METTIEPFYKDSMATLYLGDCVEGMAQLPEGLEQLIITSPPYCVGKEYESTMDFGTYLKLLSDFYTGGYRVIERGGYCIVVLASFYMAYSGNKARYQPMEFLHHIIAERAGWVHQTTRVWAKDFPTLDDKYSISTTLPKLEHEYIVTFRKPGGGREKVREQHIHPRSIWSTSGDRQSVSALTRHTAAFPESLVAMILEVYSDPGDTVIDPFMGSGTTLAVAKKMGRKGIGFEISEQYVSIAKLRLMQSTMEQIFFDQKLEKQQMELHNAS